MKFLIVFVVIYLIFRSLGKLLTSFAPPQSQDKGNVGQGEAGDRHRLRVDESDIEDADFKDVE